MVEPRDWRGVAIQLAEFRRYALAFIGALIAAVSWGAYELYTLKALVSVVDDRVQRIQTDLKKVRDRTEEANAYGRQILEIVERIDAKQRNAPTLLSVSDEEAKFIRDRLGAAPLTPDRPGKLKAGIVLPDKETNLLPQDIVAKLPKLKGVRYAIDPANNGVALVEPTSNVVFAVF
jgi:hypothetical protein